MAFDLARGQTVLFGGDDGISVIQLSDTWIWDGASWTQKFPNTVPFGVSSFAVAYDASLQATFIAGGVTTSNGGETSATWAWDGTNWTDKNPAVAPPTPYASAAMAYDALRSQMVLFGGVDYSGTVRSWTWVWK